MLKTENISYSIGKKNILSAVSVRFQPGQFSVVLGPNGSGKSSFLKLFSGQATGYTGDVWYNGINLKQLSANELARQRAVMSQQPELSFPLPADEVVMMGRYPHFAFNPNKKDMAICQEVMERLGLQPFATRNYLTLSGGEKQRVQFARVLAQIWESPAVGHRYLFLDEPINSLDIRYQHDFLQMAKEMAAANTVVVAVLHDINLALQYADRVLFLKNGCLVSQGAPREIITPALIQDVFDIAVKIIGNDGDGSSFVSYDHSVK